MNFPSTSRISVCLFLALASCSPARNGDPALGVNRGAVTTSCTDTNLPVWPSNWQTMLCHGAPASDPVGDTNPAVIDAVGTAAFPAVQSALDSNFLYLRIRTNLSVGSASCTCGACANDHIDDSHGWGFDFDTDGNPTTYEFQLLMNGASNANNRTLEFNENLVQAGAVNSPNEKAEAVQCVYAGTDADARVRVDKTTDGSNLGGDCDFFITMAFPLSELRRRGIDMKAARLVWAGSSAQAQNLSGDVVCDNQGSPTLSTSSADPLSVCFGGCCTQDSDCTAGRPTTLTVLALPMTNAQTTATVVSTAGYPSAGVIVIGSENIQYTGKTAITFTGLTRGALGSTAAAHALGATVDDYFGNDFCNTTSGICECSTAPDSCPSGQFCDPLMKKCRPNCTSAAPQGGSCSTSGNMTLCCDDGNSCTTNACTGGKCVFAPTNQGVICDDHNGCTGSGAAETAICANGACGSLVVACTDDGLGCTSDVCQSFDQACVHPVKAAGTVCRPAAGGGCDVAETCNGTSTSCPADVTVANGTPCDDSNACTNGETCTAGVCGAPTSTVTCDMPPVCQSATGASCNPVTGTCGYPNPSNGFACGPGGACNCATSVCDTVGNPAPGICEPINTCGNGVLEAGEGCDDGGVVAGDGCSVACLVENGGTCNTNAAGATGNASCVSGSCDVSGGAPGVCASTNVCGNGTLEPGEGCDDGGTASGDGCDGSCLIEAGSACNATAPGMTGNASCASAVCDSVGNAAPGVCEPVNTCGNGRLEAGEGCDDGGVAPGDGCSAVCKIEDTRPCNANPVGATGDASCASGICDSVGNAGPGVCEPANTCGNGVLEAGEGCDDGGIIPGDGCDITCKIDDALPCNANPAGATGDASCASGVCDAAGNTAPGVCEPANACGNGKLEAGEGCDDGAVVAGDGCNSVCKIEDTVACNANAAGATGNASCASGICDTLGNAAPGVCESANACGNGVLEAGEGCDDGGVLGGDGCNAACLIENTQPCNANVAGATGNASCASGSCNLGGGAPGICQGVNSCGNGVLEAGEGCDDGGTAPGDGCGATCLVEDGTACNANAAGMTGAASCASSICDTTGGGAGVCEPANTCGNGVLEAGEGCDDGGVTAGDGCGSTCLVEDGGNCNVNAAGVTGNGSCASGVCDVDGNPAPGVCEPANTCGNGKLEAGEGCDDGGTTAGNGCSATCFVEIGSPCNTNVLGATGDGSCASGVCDATGNVAPGLCEPAATCGNGKLEAGEGCDDGATDAGDGCNVTCKVEDGRPCNANTSGAVGDDSCASASCDTSGGSPGVCVGPTPPKCGNGVLDAGEGCDDGNTTSGDGCNSACLVENGSPCNATSPGAIGKSSCASNVCDRVGNAAPGVCEPAGSCGNGLFESGESCDDGNATTGDGCDAQCKIESGKACGPTGAGSCATGVCDVVGNPAPGLCEPANTCGNGVREGDEECDDGNQVDGDGCTPRCMAGVGSFAGGGLGGGCSSTGTGTPSGVLAPLAFLLFFSLRRRARQRRF